MEAVLDSPTIPPIKRRIAAGSFLSLNSVAEAAQPFFAALIAKISERPTLIVTDLPKSLDHFSNDFSTFAAAQIFPAWESLPHEDILPSEPTIAERLRTLANAPKIVLTCVQALMQKTFSPEFFTKLSFALRVGAQISRDELITRLLEIGYSRHPQVSEAGDMAVRGGIVDFFPLVADRPIRIEFFSDEIESIRVFDAISQQSREKIDEARVLPAGEIGLLKRHVDENPADLLAFLPKNSLVVLVEPEKIAGAAREYAHRVPENDRFFVSYAELTQKFPRVAEISSVIGPDERNLNAVSLETFRAISAHMPPPEVAERLRREFFSQMKMWTDNRFRLFIFCNNDGEKQRFEEILAEYGMENLPRTVQLGPLSRGFLWPDAKIAVVTDAEIFGRYKILRLQRHLRAAPTVPVEVSELVEGDFVVHAQHGIGKFRGFSALDGREVLVIEYAESAKLYVPVEQAHLVSKYIGVGKKLPQLHALGGARWAKQKADAERAIRDVAAGLLEVQAARETLEGHAFSPDTGWQREFEAAFVFEETPDQLRSIEEVKADMEKSRPMDRLLCGDVGFGKTEVAIRAAFKAVMDGKQVAVLVPTTVLAEQHFNTFRQRMADYPVKIEMLSRFRTKRQQQKIVKLLAEGALDIVIGTHRLLQRDVHFKDLGLVIIDEEQRFGVLHKEKFKQLRQLVDVLTLTATPIPRTLYLALSGVRDMSNIETPPQDRLPVETHIAAHDERLIEQAIRRELARGGQIYYLHNRVQTIESVAEKLQKLVPEARIAVGHGQMHSDDLEDVMRRFVDGDVDVLVCTTIIESGLDIPNANTIIIDGADRFGLADLYQLRGRVGRYKHQAYAYVLLPRHMHLVESARKRISAIKQYSSLGSGFKIALRDLEIRGAGNILGAEQSGHIAAIGFDLYCQLLKQSVARLKGEAISAPPAVELRLDFLQKDGETLAKIPENYVADARLRVEMYKKLAEASRISDVKSLRNEFRDRFGPLPRAVKLLIACAELRILAAAVQVDTIETRDDKIMLTSRGQLYQIHGKFPRLTKTRAEERLTEIKKLIESLCRG
jgi:transcription-repair coupling factor (superfamily II helicase)